MLARYNTLGLNKKMKKIILSLVVIATLLVVNTSCKKAKDAAGSAVETVGDAAKATGDAVKNVAEKTGDAIKNGAEAVKDGTEKIADATKEALTGNVAKGKEAFTSKGCVACHQVDKKLIGPALQNIAKVYADKKGNMVKFLKGNADAIVDTDPAQIAIMKANITGILKGISAEDLQAITAYIRSTAK